MKINLIVAIAIGSLISAALMFFDWLTSYETSAMSWQMPGIGAAYRFWGAVGSSVFFGTVIAWAVNAMIYSVPALGVVAISK